VDLNDLRNPNPKDLRNPEQKVKSSGDNPRRQSRVNWVNSISALLLAVGLTFFLFSQYEKYKARERGLNVQLAQLMKQIRLLEERLDKDGRRIGLLVTDLETVQKRVGVTRDEIRRSRAVAEEIRQQQQQDVQLLTRQLVRKADFQQVKDLGAKADTKFKEVDKQITGVQREVQASRQEFEKTWQELSAMGLRVTEQGKLIATSSEALVELRRRRGERDYLEFDARKKKKLRVADITIELRKADYKQHRADLRLFYDDRRVDRKKVYTNTPLIFYVGPDRIQYELVINEVNKDQITGYVSVTCPDEWCHPLS
jgi:hypothetical protein